jgi:1-acyl-sn-glycerol-3-phosphate acyltransferase
MRLPPRWLRRIVLWPLPVLITVAYLATIPLLVILAFVLSYLLPGKLRILRALGLATIYLFVEAFVSVAALILWCASGFGWKMRSESFTDAHYAVLRVSLRMLVGGGRRLYALEIDIDSAPLPVRERPASGTGEQDSESGPLIVMSRHAGPADSILLLHEVLSWQGRRPRIVAKALLQLDPAFDILLNRLPNRFISPGTGSGSAAIDAISELASGMTERDAFIIFPEGGNFTESRRKRAVERLRNAGQLDAAARAEDLRNLLPPRPAGSKAAMSAAPDADLVFVAHTGLDHLATATDIWLSIPEHNVVTIKWYVVDAALVPTDDAARDDMLFTAWEAIDEWVEARAPVDQAGPATDAEDGR